MIALMLNWARHNLSICYFGTAWAYRPLHADPFLARRFADRAVDGVIDPALITEVPAASTFLGELCDDCYRPGT
jgi:hypothetical protein